ncbi:hypothetical protein EB809_13600 [Marinobacter sp. R17]|uniref:hypothetical protein n=1 Tax=Marinobacter sp. R17 TaxID=2484250 RepID=UPI000F4B1F95|nr:hypothetical protein [Marinobacter sp. R17]ROT98692.1 hypothetical protein EB809_13600 [Marinobacter sp. R17]
MKRSCTLLLLSLLFSTAACSSPPVKNTQYDALTAEHVAQFSLSPVATLRIPIEDLSGVKVIGGQGLTFIYPDGSNLYFQSVMASAMGFPDANLHDWPLYLFGLKSGEGSDDAFVQEAMKSKRYVVDEDIAPREIRVFPTHNGKGYWALGPEKSLIVLTDENDTSQLIMINVSGMSEVQIKEIIKGVI